VSCILALDLGASVCGFAHGPQIARTPTFGSWHLPKLGVRGARYVALENTLARCIREWGITALVVESPLPIMALFNSQGDLQASSQAIRVQHTLAGFAEAEAYRASARYSEVSADIVRAAVLGQRRFPKGEVKDFVVAYCRSHGMDVPDDHAADACLTWVYQVAQLTGRALAGPLFV
jgi:hypothetical protein